MKKSSQAELYLLLITLFWGMTFPLIHSCIQHITPIAFVFLRFSFATFLLLPFVLKSLKYTDAKILTVSIILGAINFGAYSLQTTGLKTISAEQSAFITGINIVLVPFLSLLFRSEKPKILDFIASLLCLLGLYILTGADLKNISIGQVYTLLCAILYALAIVIIQISTKVASRYNLLAFYQILFTAFFAYPLAVKEEFTGITHISVIIAILFCSIFATVIALYVQMRFQRETTANKAALIFCLEPIFASIFGWIINHQPIGFDIYIGGSIIIISLLLPDLCKKVRKNRPSPHPMG